MCRSAFAMRSRRSRAHATRHSLCRLVESLYAIETRARRTPLRRFVGARARHAARRHRAPYGVRGVSTGRHRLQPRILDVPAVALSRRDRDHALRNVQRIAVGWSHETWLFDLHLRRARRRRRRWGCACGATRATRCCAICRISSSSSACCSVSSATAAADAEAVLVRARSGDSRRAVSRDGEGARRVSEPVGPRRARVLSATQPRVVVCRQSFTETLATLHTLDWRAAGLEFLGVPECRRRISCAARLPSGAS